MVFSHSQTENFEMEKLSSDTGYFKKTVEINRGLDNPWPKEIETIVFLVNKFEITYLRNHPLEKMKQKYQLILDDVSVQFQK